MFSLCHISHFQCYKDCGCFSTSIPLLAAKDKLKEIKRVRRENMRATGGGPPTPEPAMSNWESWVCALMGETVNFKGIFDEYEGETPIITLEEMKSFRKL